MSQRSKRSIRILNPRLGEAKFVTRRSAVRMINRHIAREAGEDTVELLGDGGDPRVTPIPTRQRETHGPRLFVSSETSLASGRYRNEVLGLPNFVGIQQGRRNAGRTVKAARAA